MLVDLAAGVAAPGVLSDEFGQPRVIYRALAERPDLLPLRGALTPLWETNGDSVTAFLNSTPGAIIRYYFGDPPDQFEVVGLTFADAIQSSVNELVADAGIDESKVLSALSAAGLDAEAIIAAAVAYRDGG